jgi:hypothetical protein
VAKVAVTVVAAVRRAVAVVQVVTKLAVATDRTARSKRTTPASCRAFRAPRLSAASLCCDLRVSKIGRCM